MKKVSSGSRDGADLTGNRIKLEPEILIRATDPRAREVQREYFKILHKQNVEYDKAEKRYTLRYYPSDTAAMMSIIPLQAIRTEHSMDDDHLKHPFARYCYYVLLCGLAALFSADVFSLFLALFNEAGLCPSEPGFLSLSCAQLAGPTVWILVAGVVLLLKFAYLSRDIEANFISVDAQWQNSIDQFFAPDVYSKMMGIRLCMLKFRQFIKWRRFANFFITLFWVSAALLTIAALTLAIYLNRLQLTEVAAAVVFFAGLTFVIGWFQAQRRKHTEWRDPTVQLSVMIAELHQRLIERTTMIGEARQSVRHVEPG